MSATEHRIVRLLRERGDATVMEVAGAIGRGRSIASYYLARMKMRGTVCVAGVRQSGTRGPKPYLWKLARG